MPMAATIAINEIAVISSMSVKPAAFDRQKLRI
jgi:hypothetical protein